jgi:hypothetical protein
MPSFDGERLPATDSEVLDTGSYLQECEGLPKGRPSQTLSVEGVSSVHPSPHSSRALSGDTLPGAWDLASYDSLMRHPVGLE